MRRLGVVGGLLVAVGIAVLLGLGFVYSGFYNVAASEAHSPPVEWLLETMAERSIDRHAGALPGPLPTDSAVLLHGFEHYRAMCEVCHGGPGVDRGEIGEGLNPRPPRLARAAREASDEELFWITKHGIKATGMPGFGATHDDHALLGVVAVVRMLPDMTEEEYADWAAAVAAAQVDHHDNPLDSVAPAPGTHVDPPGGAPHAH